MTNNSEEQRNGLPSWVWGAGMAVGLGLLGHILYGIGANSTELPPLKVGVESGLAMIAFTLAASARTGSKQNPSQIDWPESSSRGDADLMTDYDIHLD